jgi:malonyl-CoA/methylmalonyl-CoA synthetase
LTQRRDPDFLETLEDNCRHYANKVALEFLDPPQQRVTYGDLEQGILQATGYLEGLGVRPGDRVALQLSKSMEFVYLHLATLRLGGISLPLNVTYTPAETSYFLRDAGARVLFALESTRNQVEALLPELPELASAQFLDPGHPDRFATLIAQAPASNGAAGRRQPGDTAAIIYTSGTTGRPNGAEITHGNLSANLVALHQAWAWRSDDILLHVLPIFHVHGLFVALHGALNAGATTLLLREFEARKSLQAIADRQPTVFMAVPTIHRRLLAQTESEPHDLSGLRLITSGSDRLPDDLFEGFQRAFGCTLVERYGMTETGMNCSNPLVGERRRGSVGLPLPGVEVRVVDPETILPMGDGEVGELQIRGANVFKGYWRQPEKTADAFTPDGWFRTGDLGFRQADGYFTLCGRSKDLIITGGMNVYPPEVERVLAEHPAVAATAVIGCPDAEWGERVTAVVVLKADHAALAAELEGFCRERLAPYKSPKAIVFVSDLPRNAMGKVQKTQLRGAVCSENPGLN